MIAAVKLRKSMPAQIFSDARKRPQNCGGHSNVSALKVPHSVLEAPKARLLTQLRDGPSARMCAHIIQNWHWVTASGHRFCGRWSLAYKGLERAACPGEARPVA